jgi:serine-type D-Ala-D-Ala carboxypeptidase (penicillin-binding protein 5/6)
MTNFKFLPETFDERMQTGVALVSCTLLLGAIVYFIPWPGPAHSSDTQVAAVAEATTTPNAFADVSIEAKAAIVVDLSTGMSLYEKNADAQLPLASLTKLLTTYAALDSLSAQTPVTLSANAIAADGDSGLNAGETFAFADLARLELVASSNDAAEAIAETAASHRGEDMTTLLRGAVAAAGLAQTYAVNSTGLDESASVSGGYGSARDVARLAGKLLAKAPDIAQATTQSSVTITSQSGIVHTLPNTDTEVAHFPNLLLSKTGYTDLAGGNLVVIFDAGLNHPVAVAVLGSSRDARFTDVNALVSATLSHFAGAAPQKATALSKAL